MITLTLSSGPQAQLDGKTVVRIRHALRSDGTTPAKTRIDWDDTMLVLEDPPFVATAVKVELATLAQLSAPDGSPIWFNAKKSSGPLRLPPGQVAAPGARSALLIGGKREYVSNSYAEVAAVITAAGGVANPIPSDNFLSYSLDVVKSWVAPIEDWQ